ncbi:DMT family transporter [Subtercola vilae]|uniref:DMT family transporter n=1 Tax=Subtercola vilae TaxID=2056433 RepID=A0A4T2BNP9_9MICO|nr:DMT family transporter [Subtercola vilae]TIH33323.1 DMT family transporter [Subtercola vilae]
MRSKSSAIASAAHPLSAAGEDHASGSGANRGLLFGFVGVLAFSFTLPFTRVAVSTLDPLFVGAGRAVVAGVLAIVVLAIIRPARPRGTQWVRLLVVAAGVVAGFPLLTSFAMQTAPAAHGAVVIGVLPAATAVVAVVRGGERPSRRFWVASIAGLLAVIAFVAVSGGGLDALGGMAGLQPSDVLLLGAVVLAAIGYAEGGLLSRELGSWQTICWALVVALPVMAVVAGVGASRAPIEAGVGGWIAFGYVSVVSMFLGFFAWYRGLAIGPIANVSQMQLLQPVLTIVWAALLFGEHLDALVLVAAVVVVACAGFAVRARVRRPLAPAPASA